MNKDNSMSKTPKKCIIKEVIFLAACFVLPIIILVLILKGMGITYGGPVTLFAYDMREQFMPFFASLRYLLEEGYSPFFTGGVALGGNYWGILIYYMASPLSWITVLYDLKDLPDAIYLLTVLKIGLCGLTFALFSRFGLLPEKKMGFAHVIFSCCYALMSYNLMYCMSLMWIDGVIFFPLVLLGVEKLLKGKKGFVYLASIAGAFICSYYISYMIGIFTAFYIVCRVACEISKENWKNMVKILLRFAICTLLALCIAMPVLLPALQSVVYGKGIGSSATANRIEEGYHFTVIELLQKLMPVQYDSLDNSGLPSIYCGTLMYLLMLLFFLQKKHGWKKKIMAVVLLVLPVSGFLFEKIDLAWHIFQYPNGLPYRYAFIFSTVVLMFAWFGYEQIQFKTDLSKILVVIGGCYLCVELFLNGGVIFTGINQEAIYSVRSEYNKAMEMLPPLVEEIKQKEGFARTEVMEGYTEYNEAFMYGLNSVSSFVSTYNDDVNTLIRLFGGRYYFFCTSGEGLTLLGDCLYGIKYRISLEEELLGYQVIGESEYRNEIGTQKMYLHENQSALSLGYMVDVDSVAKEIVTEENPFANQNAFANALGSEKATLFKDMAFEKRQQDEKMELQFKTSSENPVYLYVLGDKEVVVYTEGNRVFDGYKIDVNVKRQDGRSEHIEAVVNSGIYLGSFAEGESVTVEVSGVGLTIDEVYLSEMELRSCEKMISALKEGELKLTSYEEGCFEGTVVAKENQVLLVTLPCEDGYTVKVDGKEQDYFAAWGALIAIPLAQGEHHVEITYETPGFRLGMMICVLGLVLSSLYLVNKGDFYEKMLHNS